MWQNCQTNWYNQLKSCDFLIVQVLTSNFILECNRVHSIAAEITAELSYSLDTKTSFFGHCAGEFASLLLQALHTVSSCDLPGSSADL